MKFKVGDKVLYKVPMHFRGHFDGAVEATGTVVAFDRDKEPLVHFDKPFDGLHDGGQHRDRPIPYKDNCWWCLPDYLTLDTEEEEKVQFKVGDKVVHKTGALKYGTIKFIDDDGSCAIRFNKKDNPKMCSESLLISESSYAMEEWYELEKPEPIVSIRIYAIPESRKTIARYFKDGKCVAQAEAKCNPADKWDANYGAGLAMARLMDKVGTPTADVAETLIIKLWEE